MATEHKWIDVQELQEFRISPAGIAVRDTDYADEGQIPETIESLPWRPVTTCAPWFAREILRLAQREADLLMCAYKALSVIGRTETPVAEAVNVLANEAKLLHGALARTTSELAALNTVKQDKYALEKERDGLALRVASLERRIAALEAEQTALEDDLRRARGVSERTEGASAHLDKLEQIMGAAILRAESDNGRMNSLEREAAARDEQLAHIESNTRWLAERDDAILGRVSRLESLEESRTDHAERLNVVEGRAEGLDLRVRNLHHRVSALEAGADR